MWPRLFVLEAKRLHSCFARKNLPIFIEHTGSTAVPGLAAKPILDILAGYPRGADVQAYVSAFVGADYEFRDRLRMDNSLRDEYATLKQDPAAKFPRDREAYIDGKESFVKNVLESGNDD